MTYFVLVPVERDSFPPSGRREIGRSGAACKARLSDGGIGPADALYFASEAQPAIHAYNGGFQGRMAQEEAVTSHEGYAKMRQTAEGT